MEPQVVGEREVLGVREVEGLCEPVAQGQGVGVEVGQVEREGEMVGVGVTVKVREGVMDRDWVAVTVGERVRVRAWGPVPVAHWVDRGPLGVEEALEHTVRVGLTVEVEHRVKVGEAEALRELLPEADTVRVKVSSMVGEGVGEEAMDTVWDVVPSALEVVEAHWVGDKLPMAVAEGERVEDAPALTVPRL